eukprot:CAMPEP_0171300146 /NCGR_PEP_ID=MMETSP0816-20121228/8955_1 /TAXON_ID=420281 /ORGANISM="Proboscia inermis, Strain CCAP1064/1" /LENGTH=170 /DNA_ID=CAMNT_0011776435 /DNA_START=69 /DNA_END=581 /DNA_ORIENTATION=-
MISTLSPKYAAQASIMRLAVTVGAWALIHGDNTAFPDTAAEAAIVLVCSLITSTACFMTNGGSTFKSFCSTTAISDVSVSNLCFVSTGRKKGPTTLMLFLQDPSVSTVTVAAGEDAAPARIFCDRGFLFQTKARRHHTGTPVPSTAEESSPPDRWMLCVANLLETLALLA